MDVDAALAVPGCEGLLERGDAAARVWAASGGERMAREATRYHVWAQTPREVWDAYLAEGYTLQEAIEEEMSQL